MAHTPLSDMLHRSELFCRPGQVLDQCGQMEVLRREIGTVFCVTSEQQEQGEELFRLLATI